MMALSFNVIKLRASLKTSFVPSLPLEKGRDELAK